MAPLSTVLRAWWWKRPVLAAPVVLPRFIESEQRGDASDWVEIAAIDPSFRLSRSFVNTRADSALLATQSAIDQAEIMWRLIDHVQPTAAEQAAGVPRIPIVRGNTPATVNRDRSYETGKEVWEALLQLSQVLGGVDFELEPIDPGTADLVQLNTFDTTQGSDKSASAVFHAGFGLDNATIVYEPAGDTVVNRAVMQGQSEFGQQPGSYRSDQLDSKGLYGIYGSFEGRPDVSATTTLQEHAQGKASTMALPIDFFTIIPAVEGRGYTKVGNILVPVKDREFGKAPLFGPGADFDYWLGDTVGLWARVGYGIDGFFTGRVTDASIVEVEDTGDSVVELTVGPSVAALAVT